MRLEAVRRGDDVNLHKAFNISMSPKFVNGWSEVGEAQTLKWNGNNRLMWDRRRMS